MRDIKFRAYIKDINDTVPVKFIDFYKESVQLDAELPYGGVLSLDEITLMQYTEQNDINGDEIYDGMIVHQVSVLVGSPDIDFTGEVKFYDGSWYIDNGKDAVLLFNETCENTIVDEEE